MARDVVCNMEVEERTAKWRSEHKAKTYYFCSPICKQKFDRSPEKFVKSA
ncbi:MAG: YHS domain-containing protein [Candidatus Bathyarchaeia archaeon]